MHRQILLLLLLPAALRAAGPETVMVTLHARPGSENVLALTIARHWNTATRLNLVLAEPHLSLRGAEGEGKTYFVEIFSWRDADIPDNAPAEIRGIWDELNGLVEARGGRPGLDLVPVSLETTATPVTPDLGSQWAADWTAKRLEHIMTLYAPDAVFHTTESGAFAGTAAIRELFQNALGAVDPTIHMKLIRTEHSGELGFESGEYEETLASVGKTRKVTGHYLIVLRRIEGEWRIAEQMWTENPAPH
jgi:ketosteroid isomerase-like protein